MNIQAGLLSLVVTAFLIQSYKALQPDRTAELLIHISQQLASPSARAAPPPEPSPPPAAALVCNILLFISLALSLTCALLATFVRQWTRGLLHKAEMGQRHITRARVISSLHFQLQELNMHTIVDAIPLFLPVSLILFLAGLISFLFPVKQALLIVYFSMCAVLVVCISYKDSQ